MDPWLKIPQELPLLDEDKLPVLGIAFMQEEIAAFLEEHQAGPLQETPLPVKPAEESASPSDSRPQKQRKIEHEGPPEFDLSESR